MNYEKPSGPMHEAIRKALEELKLHNNPYGCINLVNLAISGSDSESHYEHYLKRAKECSTTDLLPHPTSHTAIGGRSNGGGAAAPAPLYRGVVAGISGASPAPSASSPPLSPVFTTSAFPSDTSTSPGAAAAEVVEAKAAGPSKGTLLQGLLVGNSAAATSGGASSIVAASSSLLTNKIMGRAIGVASDKDGRIDDSTFNWEEGKNITNINANAEGAEKKKYSFNAVQLLRLVLIRCDALSQTKQHEKSLVDAKVAVLLSKRRSPEAYFCCGREERKLYHINESVKCFEAGIYVLRQMKRKVMQSLRAQLLAQGYGEDGTLLVDEDGVSSRMASNRTDVKFNVGDDENLVTEDAIAAAGGGFDAVLSSPTNATASTPVANAFLYQAFSYPDSYVNLLSRPRHQHGAPHDPDSDEEDYWAQRGYRMEDVQRLGLNRRQEEQREVTRMRDYQRRKASQLRRLRRREGAVAEGGSAAGGAGAPLRLDPMLLDSRNNSRGDLYSLHEASHADSAADDTATEEEGEECNGKLGHVAPSAAALQPAVAGAGSSVASESFSRVTNDSPSVHGGAEAGSGPGDDDDDDDERVFSFFPEVRTHRTKHITGSTTRSQHPSQQQQQQQQVVVEHHQQSLFRNNSETELLFAVNHYGMSPAELSAWLRMYRESRALKKMARKKTFPASVFGTTLYLLDRKIAGVRNGIAVVIENALLQQLICPGRGSHGAEGKEGRGGRRSVNVLQFIGCTAPDAQYNGNQCFPLTVQQGDVGFAVLQPKGWGGYSGCVCFALQVEPMPSHPDPHHAANSTAQGPRPSDHISIFFYFECSMVGSVKYGVRCVTGIKAVDLQRAFYEINNQRAGVHGIVGAVDDHPAPEVGTTSSKSLWDGTGKGNGSEPVSLEWPRQETAAQRAARLAALKAVRTPPPSSWLTSQALILRRSGNTDGGSGGAAAAAAAAAVSERRIKISVNNNISSSGAGTGGGGSNGVAAASNHNIITFSVSERLPVKLKSVELLPALEFAGPSVLKKASALSRRYRELVNNLPPPLFCSPVSGGSMSSSLSNLPYPPATPVLRRNYFSFYPDYCLYSDRLSSPWVIRDKEVVVFKLFFIGRMLDQEEFAVSFAEAASTGGINTGLSNLSFGPASGGGGGGDAMTGLAASPAAGVALNTSAVSSDLDATGSSSANVSPRTAMGGRYVNGVHGGAGRRGGSAGTGAGGANGSTTSNTLLYISAELQSRNNAQVFYADRRCPFFTIKESWLPFSSAVYLQSASAGNRTFASVQSNNNTVFTLSLTTAPKGTDSRVPGTTTDAAGIPLGVGIGSGGHAGVVPSTAGIGGGGFGGNNHGPGSSSAGGGASPNVDQEQVLYTVRKRIQPPSSASGLPSASAPEVVPGVAAGTVVRRGGGTPSGTVLVGTTGTAGTAATPSAAGANSGGAPEGALQGRVASAQSLTQLDSALSPVVNATGQVTAVSAGIVSGKVQAAGSSSSLASLGSPHNPAITVTPRQSYQQHQQAHVVAQRGGGTSGSSGNGAGSNAAPGPLSKAEQFSVWRSTTHGNGAEIVAEIRVLCSPYPLLKGMQLGEVRLLPGADALLVSTIMFILSRS